MTFKPSFNLQTLRTRTDLNGQLRPKQGFPRSSRSFTPVNRLPYADVSWMIQMTHGSNSPLLR